MSAGDQIYAETAADPVNEIEQSYDQNGEVSGAEATISAEKAPIEPIVEKSRNDQMSLRHENALQEAGFGRFQYGLSVFVGLALMADAAELFIMAFILPSAEYDLCLDSNRKAMLGSCVFFGMMLGAVIWGSIADTVGRRKTLITALMVNLGFSFLTAVLPSFEAMLVCRFIAGIGIGGSLPIVFGYYSEFLPQERRGLHLTFLMIMWSVAGVYVSILGWVVIPNEDIQFTVTKMGTHFASWRVFLLLCLMPCVLSLLGLFFFPESPRFLLEQGMLSEAATVYTQIYQANHRGRDDVEFNFMGTGRNVGSSFSYSSVPLGREGPMAAGLLAGQTSRVNSGFNNFFRNVSELVSDELRRITLLLCLVWLCEAFGYYGLGIWFPEYLRRLELQNSLTAPEQHSGITITGLADWPFKPSVRNQQFDNVTLIGIVFNQTKFIRAHFSDCIFEDCQFIDTRSTLSFFNNSDFFNTTFLRTDFWPNKFKGNNGFHNGTEFLDTLGGCTVDFGPVFNKRKVYLESSLGYSSSLIGIVGAGPLIDRFGRVKILAFSFIGAGTVVFFTWFLSASEIGVVFMYCLFNAISILTWNSIDVLSTELYPTHLRSTGFGFLTMTARIAAIVATIIYAHLIYETAVPVLLTAALLIVSAIFSIKIPESKDLLM